MKLRIKGEGISKPKLTEFHSSDVSVVEFKIRACEILEVQYDKEYLDSLQLSMNGKQALLTTNTDLLSTYGFVSGDTIYILGISPEVRASKTIKLNPIETGESSQSSSKVPTQESYVFSSNSDTKTAGIIPQEKKPTELLQSKESIDCCPDSVEAGLVNTGKSHIPLADTAVSSVPESYTNLVAANSNQFQSNVEKMAGLLHILMVETGFIPNTSKEVTDPFLVLPDSWFLQQDTLRLNYITASQVACTIVVSSVGPIMIVHGSGIGRKPMPLKPKDFLPSPVGGKPLRHLSLEFKNEIAFPMYIHIQREANSTCPSYFCNLPPEITYDILNRLDFKSLCRLSVTSKLFQHLSSQPRIWKRLVIRDLGPKLGNLSTTEIPDWKKYYKEEYVLARKQEDIARSFRNRPRPTIPMPPYFSNPPAYPDGGFGAPDFPGIIGGYSDLYPDLRGFGPPRRRLPFNHGIGFPRPFGPNRGFPHF